MKNIKESGLYFVESKIGRENVITISSVIGKHPFFSLDFSVSMEDYTYSNTKRSCLSYRVIKIEKPNCFSNYTNTPCKAGAYWACSSKLSIEYDLLVFVAGEAPFLKIKSICNYDSLLICSLHPIDNNIIWGPQLIVPKFN